MNAEAEGLAVALKGKVPVRVWVLIQKGDPFIPNIHLVWVPNYPKMVK